MTIERGVCHALFAYDIGQSIRLSDAEQRIAELTQREPIRRKHRSPAYLTYATPPLTVRQAATPIAISRFQTTETVSVVLYDFGAACVTYSVPLCGPLGDLLDLSDALYDNAALLRDSRQRAERLLETIRPAVKKPGVTGSVEDYVIYQVERWADAADLDDLIAAFAQPLAQVLRGEGGPLSPQEVQDALSQRISFGPHDAAIIDWSAAILFDAEAEDVRAVLEFANVELLEMRYLDDQLDDALEESAQIVGRRGWRPPLVGRLRHELRRLAELQMDAALLFEEVNNALKLIGDQYLARVYRVAAQRLHLADWDASILRKLQTLESVYAKLSDHQTNRRMEVLEWIIIILIAISIILPFVPGAAGH